MSDNNGAPWDNAYTNPLGHEKQEEDIDPSSEAFIAQARFDYELCVHFAKTFGTKSGKKVAEFLRHATIESSTWCTSFGSRDKAIDHGFAREGQNALVKDIERRIEVAKNCKTVEEYLDHIAMKGKGNGI